ncbi:2',3'-cyclic-nucleotide 3'-phosphodiesterase-like [Rhopilema esculentum]|uniref:2',3'-cyclic-nucleotide 3'-phosphodiesterase-like n=1 Tax=Rhopilema esculentum TaxID=499914 RepID=UPI0031E1D551
MLPHKSEKTIEFCKKNKLLYLLRISEARDQWSIIIEELCKIYKEDALVCKIDDDIPLQTDYKADPLFEGEEAHQYYINKTRSACEDGKHVVVLFGNEMLQIKSFQPLLEVCRNNGYITVLIEDNSVYTIDTQNTTNKRDYHGFKSESLEASEVVPLVPLYYGWFIGIDDSQYVRKRGFDLANVLLKIKEFALDTELDFSQSGTGALNLCSVYLASAEPLHHVTACFLNYGKCPWSKDYIYQSRPNDAMGQVTEIVIIGWYLTPRTIGARVRLSCKALELWGKNDSFLEKELNAGLDPMVPESEKESVSDGVKTPGEDKLKELVNAFDKKMKLHEPAATYQMNHVQEKYKKFINNLGSDFLHPSIEKGCTAHITLGCREGIHAKVTGYDIQKIILQELESEPVFEIKLDNGCKVRNYGDGQWVCYLQNPIKIMSMFSGQYC